MLRRLVMNDIAAASVWADTAYRSAVKEAWLKRLGQVSRIHDCSSTNSDQCWTHGETPSLSLSYFGCNRTTLCENR